MAIVGDYLIKFLVIEWLLVFIFFGSMEINWEVGENGSDNFVLECDSCRFGFGFEVEFFGLILVDGEELNERELGGLLLMLIDLDFCDWDLVILFFIGVGRRERFFWLFVFSDFFFEILLEVVKKLIVVNRFEVSRGKEIVIVIRDFY